MKVTRGQNCICPHCQADHEAPIEDFAIPGRAFGVDGPTAAEEDCFNCDKWFTVSQVSENEFDIRKGRLN